MSKTTLQCIHKPLQGTQQIYNHTYAPVMSFCSIVLDIQQTKPLSFTGNLPSLLPFLSFSLVPYILECQKYIVWSVLLASGCNCCLFCIRIIWPALSLVQPSTTHSQFLKHHPAPGVSLLFLQRSALNLWINPLPHTHPHITLMLLEITRPAVAYIIRLTCLFIQQYVLRKC